MKNYISILLKLNKSITVKLSLALINLFILKVNFGLHTRSLIKNERSNGRYLL